MGETLAIDELVARAKAGDADAWTVVYDEFAERIYRFLLVRVPEPADAEDLLQRVFLKVIESLPRYQERGLPFGAWMFRIARNTAIDFARTRRSTVPLEAAVDRPDDSLGPAALAERAAGRRQMRAALATLTDEQRDVIVYRFFAGLTPSEIGALMGKREGSIRALQFRALEALRRLGLEAFGGPPGMVR
jgi:RNA polymerase sigma-70 factor (ECF subfamily)